MGMDLNTHIQWYTSWSRKLSTAEKWDPILLIFFSVFIYEKLRCKNIWVCLVNCEMM